MFNNSRWTGSIENPRGSYLLLMVLTSWLFLSKTFLTSWNLAFNSWSAARVLSMLALKFVMWVCRDCIWKNNEEWNILSLFASGTPARIFWVNFQWKPRRFFPDTPFGRISRVGSVRGKNSPGQKIIFVLAGTPWRGIIVTFSSPWQGICTYWWGNWIFWRDETGPGEESFMIFFSPGTCTTTNIAKPPRLYFHLYQRDAPPWGTWFSWFKTLYDLL